jgi:predicted kinase
MITVLMGAPGAGKSTWVAKNATNEHIYNTEAVRKNRDLDIGAFMEFERRKAIKAVESGKSLIADGTHTITTHRRVWLNLAERLSIPTRLILFPARLDVLLNVQLLREHPAPRNVVVDHYQRFNRSGVIVRKEGWDEIITIER